jgi:biotin synthase
MLVTLAVFAIPPKCVPINRLSPIPGALPSDSARFNAVKFVRAISLARILLPTVVVHLFAGRTAMSDEMQVLCFFACANSIFMGNPSLGTENSSEPHDADAALLRRLGLKGREPWTP